VIRWRLDIAYDGTDFSGWARQADRRTVQGDLELWIPRVLRLDSPITLTVAGRTDAGVHARGQVAHVDLPDETDASDLPRRLRRVLAEDLVVACASRAPLGFDARFSAIWRRYVYRLWDAVSQPDPLLRHQVVRVPDRLDLDVVNRSAEHLLGLRDFAPFCRPRAGATTVRTLLGLAAARVGPRGPIELEVRADAFCHSMVRSLAGAMVAVGSGRRDEVWLASVMTSRTRHSALTVMPPHGLTLEEVGYPPDEDLATRADQARSVRSLPAEQPLREPGPASVAKALPPRDEDQT